MRSAGQACGRGVRSEAAAVSPVSVGAAPGAGAGAGRGQPLGGGARSVVAVALAGLVDEGPRELLGAAGRALPGPVLPLQRLLGQAVPLRQLPGPLRPLRLPRLVQRRRLHRQRPPALRHRRLRPRLRNVPAETAASAPGPPRQAGDTGHRPTAPRPQRPPSGAERCSSKAGSGTPEQIKTPTRTPLCLSPLSLVCLRPTVIPLEPWLASGALQPFSAPLQH